MTSHDDDDRLIREALGAARDTRVLRVGRGVRHATAEVFASQFSAAAAVVVADSNTFATAGRDVADSFRRAGQPCAEPVILTDPGLYAESRYVQELQQSLSDRTAIPVAVGSGTINDLTKLAAHRLGRPYLAVATAASMDGYTAFGASITDRGLKQTFACPAPVAVLADLDVIAAAPPGLNASGYADLLAKTAAGADWLVADAVGVEPVDARAWDMVQGRLRGWLSDPAGVRRGDPEALRGLTTGLMMGGFAMQWTQSSRPASGAEHQFSHLWDMQHHTHDGRTPSHGFKVGIGTLASLALYEDLLRRDFASLDVEQAVREWPTFDRCQESIAALFGPGELAAQAAVETRAKHPSPAELRAQLNRLRDGWLDLRARLLRHRIPFRETLEMLRQAGCPDTPEQIGISRERLRRSYEQAYYVRRRFTVLDLARRTGALESALDHLFGPEGVWSMGGAPS